MSVAQSKVGWATVQPKPAASANSWWKCEAYTRSFFGTQPRITQVPPIRYSAASVTRAPWLAAMRAARTPPDPPPMTNRSVSNSAMAVLSREIDATLDVGEVWPGGKYVRRDGGPLPLPLRERVGVRGSGLSLNEDP